MPKKLEAKLKRSGRKKGFVGKLLDKYVYSRLHKTGWTPSTQKKTKYQRSK